MAVGKGWESEEGFLEAVHSKLFQLETLSIILRGGAGVFLTERGGMCL